MVLGFYLNKKFIVIKFLDMKVLKLNTNSLVQIKDKEYNIGQGIVKKILKTTYHIRYKLKNYSVKKDILKYNTHGQVVVYINDLKQLKS